MTSRGLGLGLWARAGADPLCALILLDKYILVYPGYAKDELKNSDTWTAKIGVNTAENNNSIDNSSNYCH